MSLQGRFEMLDARHQELEAKISEELRHPALDMERLQEMKRQKLRLKDELWQIQKELYPDMVAAE